MTWIGMSFFGLEDPGIVLAHVLCLLSAGLCIVYGLINWNRGGEIESQELTEEAAWEKDEAQIDETL